jgi:hypothetical protein
MYNNIIKYPPSIAFDHQASALLGFKSEYVVGTSSDF